MPIINNTDSVRTGNIAPHAGAAVPAGYLQCDGAAVSRSTYAQLFSVIGTTYGSGDGSTTFNLPNTQGIFLSGAGSQTIGGQTYTRALGVKENDNFEAHSHFVAVNSYTSPATTSNVGSGDGVSFGVGASANGEAYNLRAAGTNGNVGNSSLTGNTETKPANLPINYIIKY